MNISLLINYILFATLLFLGIAKGCEFFFRNGIVPIFKSLPKIGSLIIGTGKVAILFFVAMLVLLVFILLKLGARQEKKNKDRFSSP